MDRSPRKCRSLLAAVVLGAALVQTVEIRAAPPINAALEREGEGAIGRVELFHDRGGQLSPGEVFAGAGDFQPALRDAPSFGFVSGAVWLRFTLHNPSPRPVQQIVELGYAMLDDVRLYELGADGAVREFRAGDRMPFDQRLLVYRNPAFELDLAAQQTLNYFVRIETSSAMDLPVRFWGAQSFRRHERSETIAYAMYFAAMAVMLLYNTFLWIVIRDRIYLYYILYLLNVSLFLLTLNGLSFQLFWPNWLHWANNALPVFMQFCYAFGLLFTRKYLDSPTVMPGFDRLLRGLIFLSLPLAAISAVAPYRPAIIVGTGLAFATSSAAMTAAAIGAIRRTRDARYYLIAWFAMLFGIVLYSLKTFAVLPHNLFTAGSMQIGILLQVVLLSLGLADRVNLLRLDLKEKLEELTRAQESIRASEARYRLLVESGRDMVLLLDTQGRIQSANRALHEHLGHRPEEIIGQPLTQLLFRAPELVDLNPELDIHGEFVARQLAELAGNGGSQVFKAEFATRLGELRHMEVRLDSVDSPDGRFILARAGEALEDSLARFIESERQSFVIGNFINIGDLIGQRICKNLSKYADPATALGIEIGVREMIINAIEHGNLGVTYEDKTHTQSRDEYFRFLADRQKDPRFRDRKVRIQYMLDRRRVLYVIQDEGEGFDHRRLSVESTEDSNRERLGHGRGIGMARNIFDTVRYNDRGNQVILLKRFENH